MIWARFLKYDSSYKFSTNTESTLFKANITNGKVEWVKTIVLNDAQGLYWRDLFISQFTWISMRNISDDTYSSILRINTTDENLIKATSFKSETSGFSMSISKLKFLNDTTMIAIGSGSITKNGVGISSISNRDIVILFINNDDLIYKMLIWDNQNGDDYGSRLIFSSQYLYYVGYSNNTTFILSK